MMQGNMEEFERLQDKEKNRQALSGLARFFFADKSHNHLIGQAVSGGRDRNIFSVEPLGQRQFMFV